MNEAFDHRFGHSKETAQDMMKNLRSIGHISGSPAELPQGLETFLHALLSLMLNYTDSPSRTATYVSLQKKK